MIFRPKFLYELISMKFYTWAIIKMGYENAIAPSSRSFLKINILKLFRNYFAIISAGDPLLTKLLCNYLCKVRILKRYRQLSCSFMKKNFHLEFPFKILKVSRTTIVKKTSDFFKFVILVCESIKMRRYFSFRGCLLVLREKFKFLQLDFPK